MKPIFHDHIEYNPLQLETAKFINADSNIVCMAPTSSGKTHVIEQFLFTAIAQGKKAIYLSPLKALTEEKKRDWENRYELTIVTGDYAKAHTFNTPLILMTTESLDSKTRGAPQWVQKVGALAVDEAHLIASANRGDSMEIGLMRFASINREARIILLSATIPNAAELAEWLTSLNGKTTEIVATDWRPVTQHHHLVVSGNKPWDVMADTVKLAEKLSRDYPEKQMLIFVHAVGRGMKFAEQLGCPFHYSKLTREKRAAIEEAFMKKKIQRLVCTSTLAYGINLPADIAIISGATRGPSEVDPIDIKQEAGRAGRYGLSAQGDVYYVFEKRLSTDYYESCITTPDVHSVLEEKLYFHIVSFIYREGMDLNDIRDFLSRSFGGALSPDAHIKLLRDYGALHADEPLRVTNLGKAAALMYLDPLDLAALSKNLSNKPTDPHGLALAFALLPSNEVPCYIPDDIARNPLECPYAQQTIVATCLRSWMKGDDLSGNFAVVTPSLTRDIDRWTSGLSIAGLPSDYIKAISIMLSQGIPYHLIELVSQRGIGRKKAKKLYDAGVKTISQLLENEPIGVAVLGKKLYSDIQGSHIKGGKITLVFNK